MWLPDDGNILERLVLWGGIALMTSQSPGTFIVSAGFCFYENSAV